MHYSFSNCELHSELFTLFRSGQPIRLRPKVYKTLEYLIEHRDRVVSKDELCNQVWLGRFVSDTTIESTIRAVRRAVGDNGRLQRVVKTQSRQGYRFVAAAKIDPIADQDKGINPAESDELPLLELLVANQGKRKLTVMFCGIHCATILPQSVTRNLLKLCKPIIQKYRGYCSQTTANGFWVCFGYFRTQEDAPFRAVKTGLDIVDTIANNDVMSADTANCGVMVGIGIHTGTVEIDTTSPEVNTEQPQLVDIADLAELVQQDIDTDSVLISDQTQALVKDMFDFFVIKPITLDEPEQTIRRYRIEAFNVADHKIDFHSSSDLSPLVQRAVEIQILEDRWKQVKTGSGQVVMIVGEAGIGKSRLVRELNEAVVDENHQRLILRSSSYRKSSPFYPIADYFQKQLAELAYNSKKARLELLKSIILDLGLDLQESLPSLAAFLSIPVPRSDYPFQKLDAKQQKEITIRVLVNSFVAKSMQQPLLLIWEDLHWLDDSSFEFVMRLLDQVPASKILAVFTLRPDIHRQLPARSFVTALVPDKLTENKTRELIAGMTKAKPIDPELIEHIVDRSDGIPLFVEECTRMLMSAGADYRPRQEDGELSPELPIPATLHDVLAARFDHFTPGGIVMQIASVVGREFDYQSLAAAAALDDSTLQLGLNQLVNAELLYQKGFAPTSCYSIKHALIQDAAYQSLLSKDRKRYHGNIARYLERANTAASKNTAQLHYAPELVAHHYEQAGHLQSAIAYWLQAGRQAGDRAGYCEAIYHLKQANKLVLQQEPSSSKDRTELNIILEMGAAFIANGGFSEDTSGIAFNRALDLCTALGHPPETLSVLSGLMRHEFMRGNYLPVEGIASQAIEFANTTNNPAGHIIARGMQGTVQFVKGQFTDAIFNLDESIALAETHNLSERSFGLNNKFVSRTHIAVAKLALGQIDTALKLASNNLKSAQKLDNHSLNYALCYLATMHHLRGDDPEIVLDIATQSCDLALKEKFGTWIGASRVLRGEALIRCGDSKQGLAEIETGTREHKQLKTVTFRPLTQSIQAKAYIALNRGDQALEILQEATALSVKTGQCWYLPELQRLTGNALMLVGQHTHAYQHYLKALDSAESLQAKFWTLVASMDFARSQVGKEHFAQAYGLLKKANSAMPEGIGTRILNEASEILRLGQLSIWKGTDNLTPDTG